MKTIFFLLILFKGLAVADLFAQSYYTERAPDAAGTYKKTGHTISNLSAADRSKAIQMVDAVVDVVKKIYPQPIGVDVGPYSGIFTDHKGASEFKNGPYRFYVTIPFFDLHKVRTGGIEASGEYSSSLQIWINNLNYMLQVNPVHYGNGRVFRAPRPGIAVNGFPKYNNMVVIIPGKSLPWRQATKQEYFENYIEGLKNSMAGRSSLPAEKQTLLDAERLLASLSQAEKKQPAYLKKIKYVNSRDGFPDFGPKWLGFQDPADTTAEQLVVIDENSYDQSLPRISFQVIVIERRSMPASSSASRPNADNINQFNERLDRMNSIVRDREFLPALRQLLGNNGLEIAGRQENKSKKKYVPQKINTGYIDRILDSLFRNYKVTLPPPPVFASPGMENTPSPLLPSRNEKKILLASRQLGTREELVDYLAELDKNISTVLGQPALTIDDNAGTNIRASFGYWLINKPKESLLLAIRAARQQPDQNCVLNNLGAVLGICGIDYFAVPLYNVCIKKEPGNSTISNNLGQSWLAIGDLQKAELYLKQAVAANPYHHHANNSLGLIYEKQGRKNEAIACYENSLRGSFTLSGINGLNRLDHKKALKLANYIRHRYKQPDYLNFNRYPAPLQCTSGDQTEKRKEEHKLYQKILDDEIRKYEKLKEQQKPVAGKSLHDLFLGKKQRPRLKSFQPFAIGMVVSLGNDFNEQLVQLQKELKEIERNRERLKLEYDTAMKAMLNSFEPRLDALGEGNADPTLEEEICEEKNKIADHYLPLFAEINEERFAKIVHVYKNHLNDYLYWIRFASWTNEQYLAEYYDIVLSMLRALKEVRLTVLEDYCRDKKNSRPDQPNMELKQPGCPMPGTEIPFVIGKIIFDCEGWGIDGGEIVMVTVDHKFGGETTIAFGAGLSFYSTPEIFGIRNTDLSPGVNVSAKGQLFITFDGNAIQDGGFLWEAEIDLKGLGKPAEVKQDFVFAINKGFYADGILTNQIDKLLDIPPEKQLNNNIKIYNPQK